VFRPRRGQLTGNDLLRAGWFHPFQSWRAGSGREWAGLPDLTNDEILTRIDHTLKYHSPSRLYKDGQRVVS